MKSFLVAIFLFPLTVFCQIPSGYYALVTGSTGEVLRAILHNIIKNNTVTTYSASWAAFQRTDVKPNGTVWDLYGYVPSGPQQYEYTFGTMQCGPIAVESDCYDRAYIWPASWFNNIYPVNSDLFNIYPADGFVTQQRGSLPFATALTTAYLSYNGGRFGACGDNGYQGTVFEPINDIKGDIARTFFYMTTRYYAEDNSWITSPATNKCDILPWQLSVLMFWHHFDPVSAKEIARNDSIYSFFQHNRNPFIDHPEYADAIWGAYIGLKESKIDKKEDHSVFPNPTEKGITNVTGLHEGDRVEVCNTLGQIVFSRAQQSNTMSIDLLSVPAGVYVVNVKTKNVTHSYKLVKPN